MTQDQIKEKIATLQDDMIAFSNDENEALKQGMIDLQERSKRSQKHIDNIEGQIAAFTSLLDPVVEAELVPDTADLTPAPAQAETIA